MVTGGSGEETSVLLLSGDMWIKRNPLPQRVAPSHSLAQVQNSIYLIDTKVSEIELFFTSLSLKILRCLSQLILKFNLNFKSPTLLQYHSSVDEWTILKPPPQLGYSITVSMKNTLYLIGSRDPSRFFSVFFFPFCPYHEIIYSKAVGVNHLANCSRNGK